jgi:hypothetical protein
MGIATLHALSDGKEAYAKMREAPGRGVSGPHEGTVSAMQS